MSPSSELGTFAASTATLTGWRTSPEPGGDRAKLDAGSAWFTPAQAAEFDNPRPQSADALLATLATTSQLLIMPEPERDRTLAAIRAFLAARPETATGSFTLPQVTGVLRATRRPTPAP